MTRFSRTDRAVEVPEHLVTADVTHADPGLASWSLAAPSFFIGWVCVGLVLTAVLMQSSRDRPAVWASGAGLGPLALVLGLEARRRRRSARPIVVSAGVDHGGGLDVVVVLHGGPELVTALNPTIEAVRSDIGRLTLARPVPDLWLIDDARTAVDAVARELEAAGRLVPVGGVELVVVPDTLAHDAGERIRSATPSLVLHAVDDPGSSPSPC